MNLLVSQGPHLSAKETTASIMQKVIIALLPALIASTVIFGVNALLLVAVTVISSVGFEYLYQKALKLPITIGDYSAVVTGILLAFNYPPTLPLWMAVIGSFVAIVVVKQLFGGIGFNFANPAIAARIVMGLSFASYMNTWAFPASYTGSDVLASATPLAAYRAGSQVPLMDMLMGTTGGVIGETSAIALLIGFVFLVATKVISPIVPVTYVGAVAIFAAALGQDPLVHVLGGGLLLGAIFMATDYTTSPYTTKGKIVFALGLAFITVMIRCFGSMTEGVSYAILLMNIMVPYINKATRQKVLDGTQDKKTTQFVAGVAVIVGIPLVFAVMNIMATMGVTTSYATGYQSDVAAMITFNDSGAIETITFDTSKETEGFGTKIGADPAFAEQFIGISSASEIQADVIAGATVTSNAAIEAVAIALGGSMADIPAPKEELPAFTAEGYQSEVTAYVKFDETGAIEYVEFDTSGETEGFGTKVGAGPAYGLYFVGATSPEEIDEIDVIAGATVTSEAVKEAVKSSFVGVVSQPKEEEVAPENGVITTAQGYQSEIKATVTFDEAGAIASVEFDTAEETEGFGTKIGPDADFAAQFIGATNIDEVATDVMAGVTVTSEAAIEAVKASFEAYANKATETTEEASATGEVITTAQGYQSEITATVTFDETGAIASVEFDTAEETEGFGTKIGPDADFAAQFIGATNIDEVATDVMAGVTVTSEAAIEAVKASFEAYANKATETTEEASATGEVITTAQGYQSEITATVTFDETGAIASVEFDTAEETEGFGTKIGPDADFAAQFIGATSADEVATDVMAGVTVTSEAAIEAVKAAFN